jgi:hypothetical protein
MKMNNCFYHDYAGGTYFAVYLNWFFDCPIQERALVWTDGVKIVWHLHGSNREDGSYDKHHGYHGLIEPTKKLLDYFSHQRQWQDEYMRCKTKDERIAVNRVFLAS